MPAGSSSDNPASNPGPRTARKAAIAPRPEARDCKNFREMPRRRWATGCVRLCFPKALITVHVLLKNSIPTGCHELYTAITNAEQLHAGTLPCPFHCHHNGAASQGRPDDAARKPCNATFHCASRWDGKHRTTSAGTQPGCSRLRDKKENPRAILRLRTRIQLPVRM